MPKNDDVSPELYAIMDESKLTAGHLLSAKRSMPTIVTEMRGSLAVKLKSYIARREAKAFNEGVESQRGKS